MRLPLEAIIVHERLRRDLGDLAALALSIGTVGLLHPIVVRQESGKYVLVAGLRRLAAVKQLGWDTVPVTVAKTIDDAYQAIQAEYDENTCRKDFTLEEAVYAADAIEAIERPAAKDRQAAGLKRGAEPPRSAKLAEREKGETREKAARSVGKKRSTLAKARAVVRAAEQAPKKYRALVDEMNKTGRAHGAFRKLQVAEIADQIRTEPQPLPKGPFRVIVVDPAWPYGRSGDPSHRGATPYPTTSVDDIKALPVKRLVAENGVVLLWVTNAFMREGYEVAEAWGGTVKTILTWVKPKMGTGDWLRGRTEHCLVVVWGRPAWTLTTQTTVLEAPVGAHSEKPDKFFALVESLCPAPENGRLEMFARKARKGWQRWGSGEADA